MWQQLSTNDQMSGQQIIELEIKQSFYKLRTSLVHSIESFSLAVNLLQQGKICDIFLNPEELFAITAAFRTEHGLKLETAQDAIIPYIQIENGVIQISFAFPVIDKDRSATIYHIHSMPKFVNHTRLTPLTQAEFVIITNDQEYYAIMDSTEVAHCLHQPHRCRITMPLKEIAPHECGLASFLRRGDKEICQYHQSNDMTDFFVTKADTTIYSLPVPRRAFVHCPEFNSAGPEQTLDLTGRGYITISAACYLQVDKFKILGSNSAFLEEVGNQGGHTHFVKAATVHQVEDHENTDIAAKDIILENGNDFATETELLHIHSPYIMFPSTMSHFKWLAYMFIYLLLLLLIATTTVAICYKVRIIQTVLTHFVTYYDQCSQFISRRTKRTKEDYSDLKSPNVIYHPNGKAGLTKRTRLNMSGEPYQIIDHSTSNSSLSS
jgi:hypothetical protein